MEDKFTQTSENFLKDIIKNSDENFLEEMIKETNLIKKILDKEREIKKQSMKEYYIKNKERLLSKQIAYNRKRSNELKELKELKCNVAELK
jgi:hypothetical protein